MQPDQFADLAVLFTDSEWLDLEAIGSKIHYPAGSILVGEGEETRFALLIHKGHVKVVSGNPRRIVAIRNAREMVAEMASVRQKPRSASVFALDDVEAIYISETGWRKFLADHSRAALAQLYATEERLAEATQKTVESLLGAEQKLARGIIELHARGLATTTSEGVLLNFGQQDLADIAGVSLDSVKQILRLLRTKELVSTRRHAVIILDLKAIQSIASGEATSLQ